MNGTFVVHLSGFDLFVLSLSCVSWVFVSSLCSKNALKGGQTRLVKVRLFVHS